MVNAVKAKVLSAVAYSDNIEDAARGLHPEFGGDTKRLIPGTLSQTTKWSRVDRHAP